MRRDLKQQLSNQSTNTNSDDRTLPNPTQGMHARAAWQHELELGLVHLSGMRGRMLLRCAAAEQAAN